MLKENRIIANCQLSIGNSLLLFVTLACPTIALAQTQDAIVISIVKEATENSQLESLAHALLDGIGPRLTGTPQLQKANDWVKATYSSWGINARNEKWGEWRGWERGISHVDMIEPRVKSLQATQLAWSASTGGKALIAPVILLPDISDSLAFSRWLPAVKGKLVMISMNQPTGRPENNWKEFATPEAMEKMKASQEAATTLWTARIKRSGYSIVTLPAALEAAGAAGIVASDWSKEFGADKIFDADVRRIPTVDIALEDYGLLYRLAESGTAPVLSIRADSKELGNVPVYNSFGEIQGDKLPGEYVMLSAHLDSWDGAAGATDNGTGTLTMMEAMRILKKVYIHPKRTILAGHWSGEEQGLNGSRAFVEDHPEIIQHIQALFNQDNGTGRVNAIDGQGFEASGDFIGRWLEAVPELIRKPIQTKFPGIPSSGGSDHSSFVAAGAPAFMLSSLSWSYRTATWHTNLDTYDKIIFDEVRNNAILTAILVYKACEDPQPTSRVKSKLPVDSATGLPQEWPKPKKAVRRQQ